MTTTKVKSQLTITEYDKLAKNQLHVPNPDYPNNKTEYEILVNSTTRRWYWDEAKNASLKEIDKFITPFKKLCKNDIHETPSFHFKEYYYHLIVFIKRTFQYFEPISKFCKFCKPISLNIKLTWEIEVVDHDKVLDNLITDDYLLIGVPFNVGHASTTGSHYNAFIYNTENKDVYVYDPYGTDDITQGPTLIKGLFEAYNIPIGNMYSSKFAIQRLNNDEKLVKRDIVGYCVMWTLMFLRQILKHPTVSINESLKNMQTDIDESGMSRNKYARVFATKQILNLSKLVKIGIKLKLTTFGELLDYLKNNNIDITTLENCKTKSKTKTNITKKSRKN
jgi:hypothetical protein